MPLKRECHSSRSMSQAVCAGLGIENATPCRIPFRPHFLLGLSQYHSRLGLCPGRHLGALAAAAALATACALAAA